MKAASVVEPAQALDYGKAPPHLLQPKLYRTALFCGGLPIVAGVVVLLLWLLGAVVLASFAGLLTLMCGGVMLCVGAFCLLTFLVQVCHYPPATREHWWPRLFLSGVLLFGNALVCYLIIRGIGVVLDGVGV